jgi:pilus assembly protein CpaB
VTARRRRGALLLSIALASGGLAASQIHERERRAAERLGPLVEVLVAARDLEAGSRLRPAALAFRRVPARFAPPDALRPGARVVGARLAVPVAAGAYLTGALFEGAGQGRRDDGIRRGERAVTVEVAGGTGVTGLVTGGRVDVLVSTETGPGGGRTQMALAGAELLRLSDAAPGGYPEPGADTSSAGPTALATLRVTLHQAIYLTAADNFANEIRLLPRPPGDRSRAGVAISQSQL